MGLGWLRVKTIILTIALCLAIGYIAVDYFTQPNLDEEVELQWLLCGMDMQILEQDLNTEIEDDLLHGICDALIDVNEYLGGLEITYEDPEK